jgi:Xaa-Pro dipeptidase
MIAGFEQRQTMAMIVKPVQSGPVAIIEHEVPAKLRGAMIDAGHDALVAFSQDNVTYTAGFLVPSHASNRFRRTITVLAQDKFAAQIVVNVEENLARQRSRFSDIRAYNQFTQDPADVLADALLEAGVGSGQIAMELDYMPAQDYIRLRERLPRARFVPCRELYFNVRMIKTEAEITLLREVGTLTDRVMGQVLRETRVGMTEKSVAQSIGNRMLEGGCDGFKCQVGSGARSGITNCTPTDKRIEEGDILRVEILGDMKQYRSNVTRTAMVGAPTQEQREIWRVLIGAREACKSMLKPGTVVADLYRIYVDYLRNRGIEPTLKFLGHGIGQTIHEEPYITDTRTVVLQPNITCTMEPLYMIPGRMGFHVEDMYRIMPNGFEAITGAITPNDELIEVG